MLLLGFNMTQRQQQQQEGKQNHQRLEALLSVPLHAKYPEPHAFGFQGWQALSSGECSSAVVAVAQIKQADCTASMLTFAVCSHPLCSFRAGRQVQSFLWLM